jgi:hypothetical protein
MFDGSACAGRALRFAACLWLAGLGGCLPTESLDRAGVSIRPPEGWTPVEATTWAVPGRPLAAWRGPGGASLVVYLALPAPGVRAASLGDALANRLENLPGLRVVGRSVETVAGLEAARVEAVAPGLGDALAPSGTGVARVPDGRPLRPTREVVVLIPRPADVLGLVWHAPEEGAEALREQARATLATLAVRKAALQTSSY